MGKKTDTPAAPASAQEAEKAPDPFEGQGGSYHVDESGKKTLVARTDGDRLRRKAPGLDGEGTSLAIDEASSGDQARPGGVAVVLAKVETSFGTDGPSPEVAKLSMTKSKEA